MRRATIIGGVGVASIVFCALTLVSSQTITARETSSNTAENNHNRSAQSARQLGAPRPDGAPSKVDRKLPRQTSLKVEAKVNELKEEAQNYLKTAHSLTRDQRVEYVEKQRAKVRDWEESNNVPEGTIYFMAPVAGGVE